MRETTARRGTTKRDFHISGRVGMPIIGPDVLVVVWGDNVPKLEMKADCTIYLPK